MRPLAREASGRGLTSNMSFKGATGLLKEASIKGAALATAGYRKMQSNINDRSSQAFKNRRTSSQGNLGAR